MRLGLIRKHTEIDFIKYSKYYYGLSILLTVLFFGTMFTVGYNWGIDFKGGVVIELKPIQETNKKNIETVLSDLKISDYSITNFANKDLQIVISVNAVSQEEFPKFLDLFKAKIIQQGYSIQESQFIGPSVSRDLLINGLIAIILSLVAIFVYVWIRFDWQYGLIAFITLVHDSLTCLVAVSIFQMEINLTAIAALLTVIAYSINDTVVLFDQVRENLKRSSKLTVNEILNKSINQVLSRSVSTVLTVLLVLLSVFIYGGSSLHVFSFILLVGCAFGAYSSICLSVPLLSHIGNIKKHRS